MKKIIILLSIAFGLTFLLNENAAKAEGKHYPTGSEIEAMNQELEGMVEELNERLANGEKNIEISSENLTVGFKEVNGIQPSSISTFDQQNLNIESVQASSIGSKSYQAFVSNTNGFNFRHAVYGTFTWNGDKLAAVTADEDLSGPMYSKSASTKIQGVDGTIGSTAKIGKVSSNGKFTPLKWSPASFYTTLIVDVYAPTQSYRIITAKISS
ncbi:hypothetical protein AB685_08465 [Bacillus sp. LL01]|uniref:hypothetical protein n=1 Tax=Bacillus sp. LL01 TaxID=1665556 RepID=UPI00064D6881|nr:hypothetical protein [Bacillus sp. LL01]KMJ59087.1 hypothetical protein AB685_08465 [Bacillus sp. LL01]